MTPPLGSFAMNPRSLIRTFVSGLAITLPILITFAVMVWLLGAAESVLGGLLKLVLPSTMYRTGMGLVAGLLLIFIVGLLTRAIVFRKIIDWIESQMLRIPGVKTVYGAVRDLTGFFSSDNERRFSKVVVVQLPNLPIRLVGFVTVEDFSRIPIAAAENEVAVYMPMSYQIGGYTIFVPRSMLTPVDMTLEDAMRFVVTAGMSRREDATPPKSLSETVLGPQTEEPDPHPPQDETPR